MDRILEEIRQSREFFVELAAQGVELIKQVRDSKDLDVQTKGHREDGRPDFVTRADREVDELYVQKIATRYPHWKIISEEAKDRAPFDSFTQDDVIVTIDPLDGTGLFANGMPGYSTMISVAVKRGAGFVPVLGVIHIVDGPLLWGFHDGKRSETNIDHPKDEKELSSCVFSRNMQAPRPILDRILDTLKMDTLHRRGVGPHAHGVASGETDLFAYENTNVWDVFPVMPIIHATGGKTSDVNGGPVVFTGKLRFEEGFIAYGARLDHSFVIEKVKDSVDSQ